MHQGCAVNGTTVDIMTLRASRHAHETCRRRAAQDAERMRVIILPSHYRSSAAPMCRSQARYSRARPASLRNPQRYSARKTNPWKQPRPSSSAWLLTRYGQCKKPRRADTGRRSYPNSVHVACTLDAAQSPPAELGMSSSPGDAGTDHELRCWGENQASKKDKLIKLASVRGSTGTITLWRRGLGLVSHTRTILDLWRAG